MNRTPAPRPTVGRGLRITLSILTSSFLAFFAPTSAGQLTDAPTAPSAVVAEVVLVREHGGPGNQYDSIINLSFRFAIEDPDQDGGSFAYNFSQQQEGQSALYTNLGHVGTDRTGWGLLLTVDTGPASGHQIAASGTGVWTFNVTAQDDSSAGNPTSGFSCTVTLDLRVNGTHDQCGAPVIRSPTGAGLAVVTPASPDAEGLLRFVVTTSPDDPDTADRFTYQVYASFHESGGSCGSNVFNEFLFGQGCDETPLLAIAPEEDANPPTGFRRWNVSVAGSGAFQVEVFAEARDNRTRQRAENLSCVVRVEATLQFNAQYCGASTTAGFSDVVITPTDSSPSFPLLDVGMLAESMELSESALAFVLAGLLMIGFGVLGFTLAGIIGAVGGVVLGFVAGYALGLLPGWLVVVVFLGLAGFVVLNRQGGA